MKMKAVNVFVFLTGFSLSLAAKWSYTGDSAPKYWHELFPEACSGEHQSPIDIKAEQTMYDPNLKDFAIWYDPPKPNSTMVIKNNAHTVQVNLDGEFFVTNGGLQNVYKAAQFHFHWGHKAHFGSEHLLDGKASPIEMHLVTYNQDVYSDISSALTEKGGLAVLGVMFEVSKEDNPVLENFVKSLKYIQDPHKYKDGLQLPLTSLRNYLPQDISRYYRYNGSLTTPNCFESVIWTVFEAKQTISHRQLREFRKLLQFRRAHKKVDVESQGRHKRSSEHGAELFREELGIQGDSIQEAELKAKLLEDNKKANLPSDQSHHNSHSKQKDDIMDDTSKPDQSQSNSEAKYETIDKRADTVDQGYKQPILVDNFRPVQPLNGRLVYRSFKLREEHSDSEVIAGRAIQDNHHHSDRDSARDLSYSIFTLIMSIALSSALRIVYN